jgi:hypothetical protein
VGEARGGEEGGKGGGILFTAYTGGASEMVRALAGFTFDVGEDSAELLLVLPFPFAMVGSKEDWEEVLV